MAYRRACLAIILIAVLNGCSQNRNLARDKISSKSNEELIQLLKDKKDPNNLFGAITKELAKRGSSASEAAPTLATALTYPRRDAYLAGFALIAMGPDAKSAIPILVTELSFENGTVRRYAALSLGAIGTTAGCAIPALAPLLWHPDLETRSAVATSIDAIVEIDLVDPEAQLDPKAPGVLAKDEPEGIVSGKAREWWKNTGQYVNWPTENCKAPT